MAPAPNPGPSATTLAAGIAAIGFWRLSAVAAPHLAALVIMLQTEADFSSRIGFVLSWGILNCLFIALLRRPALSGALSLTLVVMLVLLSRLKHDVVQMTANFVDLMVIDRDTAAFLFTIFPNLRWSVIGLDSDPARVAASLSSAAVSGLPRNKTSVFGARIGVGATAPNPMRTSCIVFFPASGVIWTATPTMAISMAPRTACFK